METINKLICPYCGEERKNVSDRNTSNELIYCWNCKQHFVYSKEVLTKYTSVMME